MALGERIKKIRKELDLTQRDFGAQIGTTQNAIASYEIGRREPSASAINNICKTFNVSERWFRTGEGEMFRRKSRSDELAAFMDSLMQSEPDDIRRRFVTVISQLDTKELEILEKTALHLADSLNVDRTSAADPVDEDAAIKEAARKKAEAYYEQLLLEASARTSEESTPAKTG